MMGWNGPNQVPFELTTELSPDDVRRWLEIGGADPEKNPIIKAGASLPVMRDIADPEIIDEEERRRNSVWGEFYNPADVPHICFTPLWSDGHAQLMLCVFSSAKQGPIQANNRRRFRALAKRWRAAAMFSRSIKTEGLVVLRGALDAISIAAIAIDGFGRAVALSAKAETAVRAGHHLRLRNGILSTCSAVGDRMLHGAIRRALLSQHSAPQVLSVESKDRAPILVKIAPLPDDQNDIGFGARALVTIEELPVKSAFALGRAFGLTKAEAETASMLADALSMEEIASSRQVGLETVRSQAKAVYSKMGVGGQLALIAKLRGPCLRRRDESGTI
jgi:DNA-binding CsgD family transcriptional regulator